MITDPYLLILNVPLHRYQGSYWADPLWKKDLEAHLAQISDLSIACPVLESAPADTWQRISRPEIRVHPLPAMGWLSYLILPYLAAKIWKAVSAATIVHTGVAGWPYPLGWIAVPIARLRRRFLVIVVESAFWRIPPGVSASRLAKARAFIDETVNKALIRRCNITFFTTRSYRDTLHGDASGEAHILPAVWVDDDQLIPQDRLAAIGQAKNARILFAGRLTAAKGVGLLLDAVALSGVAVDFVGDGDLRGAVIRAREERPELVRLIDPVDYGAAFSDLLDGYAALVVPTISDEQPRIIFDAFARGVPVLASATTGNRQIVDHGRNGLLHEPNDVQALAGALIDARRDPAALKTMGRAALQDMSNRTHSAMHAVRARTIADALGKSRKP